MAKLDWEKANAREKASPKRRRPTGSQRAKRKGAMFDFANRHNLACFNCGQKKPSEWAKTGYSKRGPWAICLLCIERRKSK